MNDVLRPILAPVCAMWHRRWPGLLAAWVAAALFAGGILLVPDRWEADARVFVDTQTVLKPLLTGLAVEPNVDQMVAMLARTLVTRPNMEKLIGMADLAPPQGFSPRELDSTIDHLTKTIKLDSAGQDVFLISYRDTDPQRAKRVVQSLMDLFIGSTAGGKRRDSEEARAFIDEQIAEYERKLEDSENRLKDFQLRHFGLAGAGAKDQIAHLSELSDQLNNAEFELHSAEGARDALKAQVEGVGSASTSVGAGISPTADLDARIDALRVKLDDLKRRFTDQHPDVIETKRIIAQLVAERQTVLARQHRSGATIAIGSMAGNPLVQKLAVQLAEADAGVAGLRARTQDLRTEIAQVRAQAQQAPEVEAQMARLNRDYAVIRANYETLVNRREQAAISEDVDANAKMAVFRVIDPPRVQSTPVYHGRLALVPLALFLSVLVGLAVSYVLVLAFPRIEDPADLRAITERPMLAAISMRISKATQRRERRGNAVFAVSASALILSYAVWIAWVAAHSTVV